MAEIEGYIEQMISYVWGTLFHMEMLPGVQTGYIYCWFLLVPMILTCCRKMLHESDPDIY